MQKNVSGQKIVVRAFNRTTNVPITGDAANITANIQKDFGVSTATNDLNPTELEGGFYVFDATQAETDADSVSIYPVSVTADIQVVGVPDLIVTTPPEFANAALATRDQVGNLATGSAAISVTAESVTVAVGTVVNTLSDSYTVDGVEHQITDVAGQIDFYYQFDVGGNGVATSLTFNGRLQGSNDDIDIYAYDWGTLTWDQIGNLQGANSTTNGIVVFDNILTKHTGTGANLGLIRLRAFKATGLTSATMYIDQTFVSYAVVTTSVGYDGGQVWVDTVNGTAGTESFVNGTADNPVNSFASALTIADNVGLHRYALSSDTSLTLITEFTNSVMSGEETTVILNGQDLSGSHFSHCNISGIGLSTTEEVNFIGCELGLLTINKSHFDNCGLQSTITLGLVASDVNFIRCDALSDLAAIDFGTAGVSHDVHLLDYHGEIEIKNFNAGLDTTDELHITGMGNLTFAANCEGTVYVDGSWNITNNGSVIIINDDIQTEVDSLVISVGSVKAETAVIVADTNELQLNQGNWLTATGFSTVSAVAAVQAAVNVVNVDLANGTDGLGALKDLIDAVAVIDAAIKVKTDSLTFTKINELDVNTQSINNSTIIGDGKTIPWEGV